MTEVMDNLLALQTLQFRVQPLSSADQSEIVALREKIPVWILTHVDRLLVRGKKGVAIVRNGVCSECHLRLCSGIIANLADTCAIQVCSNCGRFLFVTETERVAITHSHLDRGTEPPLRTGTSTVRQQRRARSRR
jgi:hypothetical protein